MKDSTSLDEHDLRAFMEQFASLSDPELIFLKAHVLVERLLFVALATRLDKTPTDRTPRLGFGALVELAVRRDEDRAQLRCFNDLRNALAHEFAGMESSAFQAALRRLGVVWPDEKANRVSVAKLVGNAMIRRAFLHYMEETYEQVRQEPPGMDVPEIEAQDEELDRLREDIAELESQFTVH